MFWDNEDVLAVVLEPKPKIYDRVIVPSDKVEIIEDKEHNKITLAEHKKKYPFCLAKAVKMTVETNKRKFSFTIPEQYVYNGADIPKPLWSIVGSQYNPEFKIAALGHDAILEFKDYIMSTVLKNQVDFKQYRRLTTLIFRQLLKDNGVGVVKSNIMAGAVAAWQFVSPQWWGMK